MVFLPIILLLLGAPQRPMSEMHGDCDQYALDLTAEFEAWAGPRQDTTAQTKPENAVVLSFGKKTLISLSPMADITFPAPPPEGKQGFEGSFGGILKVTAQEKGGYRFCLSGKAWLDVVDPTTGAPLKSRMFEMQTQCKRIFKVVVFDLEPNRAYLVQLAFCPEARIQMLAMREK